MNISIVIPTYNEAQVIGGLLESIAQQSVQPFEVIVVDNNNTDDTNKIVHKFTKRLPVRIIAEKQAGPQFARNAGARSARGDFVYFIDADATLPPKNLETIANFLTSRKYDVVLIPSRMPSKILGLRAGALMMNTYVRTMRHTPWPIGFSCYCIRREDLLEVGGFDTEIPIMEDYDLILRLYRNSARIGYIKDTYFIASDRRLTGETGKNRLKMAFRAEIYRYTHHLKIDPKKFRYEMGGGKLKKRRKR